MTSENRNNGSKLKNKVLFSAITACLPLGLQAAEFTVTEAVDDGTGLVAGTLSKAILDANSNPGHDTIILNTNVGFSGVMKRLIDSDVTLQSDQMVRTISGLNAFRPLFVKSGNVQIKDITLANSSAKGGNTGGTGGAPGAGMGGSLFIYDGDVKLNNVTIDNSVAVGGDRSVVTNYANGGGGMFGNAAGNSGGGLFGDSDAMQPIGGYGGYGNYQNNDAMFGTGGYATLYGQQGGFGGGGGSGYFGGRGGFGGGGGQGSQGYGYGYVDPYGGYGGFGAGGGTGLADGAAGYAAGLSYSAGLGGAVFVRSGSLRMENVTISNSTALSDGTAKGLGGGIFILHSTNNSNGNNQGMPSELATVSGCGVSFTNNSADNTDNNGANTDDVFDLGNRIQGSLDGECPIFKNGFED
ncbi:hypothetical protein ACFODZ_07895 [Marinicella sediminis]|uniref:Uncharacterized protein n=1 Tax=Marinicella sediminis TaxID=1792834 RepID=A0ABV7J7U3_9GAMM|nr:hypothetical protein [Marinicella sediminis]